MNKFLKDVFEYFTKRRSVVFLGRAGLNCYYKGEKFFIDSEMLVGPPNNIVIYSDRVYQIKGSEKYTVDGTTKTEVLAFLKTELQKQKIKFEVF